MRATTWLFCASLAMAAPCHDRAWAQGSVLCNDVCQHWMGWDRPAPPPPAPAAEPDIRQPLSIVPPPDPATSTTTSTATAAEHRRKRKPPLDQGSADPAATVDAAGNPLRPPPLGPTAQPIKLRKIAVPLRAPRNPTQPAPSIATVKPASPPASDAMAPTRLQTAEPPASAASARSAIPAPVPAAATRASPMTAAKAPLAGEEPSKPPLPQPTVAVSTPAPVSSPEPPATARLDPAPLVFVPQDSAHIIARARREQREAMPNAAAALNDLEANF